MTIPALLVGGRYDECTPAYLAEMHSRIPGSQLETIEDASHLCFAEQPEIFNALVNHFLDRQDAAAG
ncbi:MAG TPA: alpha/beta hydrolase [Streptosporangiaceae bacterium]